MHQQMIVALLQFLQGTSNGLTSRDGLMNARAQRELVFHFELTTIAGREKDELKVLEHEIGPSDRQDGADKDRPTIVERPIEDRRVGTRNGSQLGTYTNFAAGCLRGIAVVLGNHCHPVVFDSLSLSIPTRRQRRNHEVVYQDRPE